MTKTNTKRILIVLGKLDRGGAETVVMNYYHHMDRNKIQFDFVVHSPAVGAYEDEIKSLGGRIWHIPRFKIYNIVAYRKAWQELLQAHPEFHVIHAHMASTACVFIPIAKKYGIKIIVHSHSTHNSGGFFKRKFKVFSYYILRYMADYFFGCSTEAGADRFGKDIVDNPRFHVWYNAIDISRFYFSAVKRKAIRDRLQIADDTFVIGHVGRMVYPKNHKFLLQVFQTYVQEHPNSKLLLLGTGDLQDEIKALTKTLGIADSVIFTGAVDNVEDYLSAMDVFVFPSHYEGLPVSVVEAQAAGLYCVVSDAVTKDVRICDNIEFVSLQKTSAEWCRYIEETPIIDREHFHVQNTDYDINEAVKKAERFYLSL